MDILQKLTRTQEFATLPEVATKILNLTQEEDVDVRKLAHLIETDAPLTIKVLKVSNSAIYGLRSPVASITQAIITIGLNRLANIVMGISIFSHFMVRSNPEAKQVLEKFWWHSSSTAIVAKSLVEKIGKNFKELEFIGGLLHDFGKMLMMQFDFRGYQKVIDLIQSENLLDIEAERKIFGVHHLEVGDYVARHWKLPTSLINIIGKHSKMVALNQDQELTAIIRFADLLCEIWGADFYEGYKVIDFSNEEAWKIITDYNPQLKDLDLEKFTFELEEDFKKSSEFLKIISS